MSECLCSVLGPFELLALWQSRAKPVVKRLIQNGHRVDLKNMTKVTGLVVMLEYQHPSTVAEENRHHSHHALWCPARVGGARCNMPNVCDAPSVARK